MKRLIIALIVTLVVIWLAKSVRAELRHRACLAGLVGRYADLSQPDKDSLVADCEAETGLGSIPEPQDEERGRK